MLGKRVKTGQIRTPTIIVISIIFLAMIISSSLLKLTAPDKEAVQTLISELIVVIVFPLLMFIFHIVLIRREIQNSEEHLSVNLEEIEESISNVQTSIDTSIFKELVSLRIAADNEIHEKKKIQKLLHELIETAKENKD